MRRENNRSKGFGFIEFESEKDQQSALEKLNKTQVKGRELILRIAYIDNPSQTGSQPAASDSAAPATTAPRCRMGDKNPKSQQKAKKQADSQKSTAKAEHARKHAPPPAPAPRGGKGK